MLHFVITMNTVGGILKRFIRDKEHRNDIRGIINLLFVRMEELYNWGVE